MLQRTGSVCCTFYLPLCEERVLTQQTATGFSSERPLYGTNRFNKGLTMKRWMSRLSLHLPTAPRTMFLTLSHSEGWQSHGDGWARWKSGVGAFGWERTTVRS